MPQSDPSCRDALSRRPDFERSRTVPLDELLRWASGNGLSLFSPDGEREKDPGAVLSRAARGEVELDHDLTISSEVAADLGLGALWHRLRSQRCEPGGPAVARLVPARELVHLLDTLSPELQFSALAVCDPLGRLAAVSGAAEGLLAYRADGPLLGRSLEDLLEQPGLLAHEDVSRQVEIPVHRREALTLGIEASPYRNASGRRSGWLVRFHTRPFLATSAINWQNMIEHFPGVVLRLDREGRVIFANRRVGSFNIEEVQGKGVFDLIRDDARVTAHRFRDLVVHQKSVLTGELPVYDARSKETIWYSFSAVPTMRGDDVEMMVYATDISLRVQAEEDLRASRDRIQSLSIRLDRAQEEERRRISRELHDELGGMLTALRLELGALDKVEGLPGPARERLEAAEGILSLTLATVRRLATQLRPPALDDLGLTAALEALLRDASRRCGFEMELQVPSTVPGDTDLHLHLYRICQEAVTNVCRHSRASRVKVGLTRPFRDRLDLVIEDDGQGYQPDQVALKKTNGLRGIAERVQLLGGKLEVQAGLGQGCRLRAEVPLSKES